jgi:putative phosphoesterase
MKMLVLSDVHSNWPALEAVARTEATWDELVFCGDAVDYGPHPAECVRWLRATATHAVRGNHDNALAFDQDCRCMGPYRPYSLATRAWHRTLLAADDIEYLRHLFALDVFERGGRHFRVAHATPCGGLFEYVPQDRWGELVAGVEADFILLGHTHVQGTRAFGRVTVVNPGSVGLARDRGGEACYAVIEDGRVDLRRVPYDVDRTVADLRAAPLPADVIDGLVSVVTTGRFG